MGLQQILEENTIPFLTVDNCLTVQISKLIVTVSRFFSRHMRVCVILHFIATVLAPETPSSTETGHLERKAVYDNLTNVLFLDFSN